MDWHFDTGLRADLFGVFREREENVMKLGKKNLLVVSVMLFALFFGAGNLIFPPFLGQNAGANTLPAMVGFLVTAVILPVLGVVVVARFDGLEKLGRQVGKRFALVFAVLIYLSIGPGLGIPRAASVPFEMAVAPYLPENSNAALWMAAYSLVFFLVALWLCLNPGKLVDRITTDENGKAVTKKLPIGEYTGKEVTAPKFFLLNDQTFSFKIKKQDQRIKVTIENSSKKPQVEIEKRGNVEVLPGQEMSYTLSDIRNNSNCSLDNFYFEDALPTDAVRIAEIHIGTFNEILNYRITYRTNMTGSYRVLADNLSTQVNHDISCAVPGLAANEYITAIRFEFETVQEGFANERNPVLDVNVLPDLPDGHRIQNSVTISGTCDGVPVYDKDYWVTVIVRVPDKPLPKTGVWE